MKASIAPNRRADPEAGTSVVEMMVATLLLSVGALAVVASIGAAARATRAGELRSVAVQLAADELEAVRAVPFDQIGISTADPDYEIRFEGRRTVTETANRIEATGQIVIDQITFDLRRQVTWGAIEVGGARIEEGFKQVTIIVTWTDPSGSHEVRQDTGIYDVASTP
jgi:hypothetical protein